MKELRIDQAGTLNVLRETVMGGRKRVCMQAPTGWGKTVLAAALVESARSRDKRVLITVPLISLVDQTVEMLAGQGITEVGVIQAAHNMSDWNQPVQVASVQTLMKRTIPQADVVLIDECHKWFKFYERWVGTKDYWKPEWSTVPIIGLSATPWTKGLGSWFNGFHKAATIQEMIDAGHLSPFRVYAPTHPDLSGIRLTGDDYNEADLSERMRDDKLIADAIDTWVRLGEDRPTLCYGVDRAHAKMLQQRFQAAGIPCGYQDAYTKADERRNIKRDFHNGKLKVVSNVGTLTTGVDWDVRCISMNRPTRSDMLFVQIVGRGLRTAEGKENCLILDHSSNHTRLGFVTDIDESYTGLHVGKTPQHDNRVEGIRLPKECPQCTFMKPPRMAKCPACGFTAQVVSRIGSEEGELRELKRPEKVKIDRTEGHLIMPATLAEKGQFYAELKGYARRNNYNMGWAAHKYHELLGVWPANEIRYVQPTQPRLGTANWIKSRMIAYAAEQKAKGAVMR